MRNDIRNDNSITNYISNGYGTTKQFFTRTLNPVRKKLHFQAKNEGGQLPKTLYADTNLPEYLIQ